MRSLRGRARLLQWLLPASLLLAAPEWPPRATAGPAQAQLRKRLPASAMEIPPAHYPASRAAGVALHYLTYQRGSPHRLFDAGPVSQASLEDIPGTGHKYHLKFEVEEIIHNGSPMNCTAEILYHHSDTHVPPDVHYTIEGEFETDSKEADSTFYNRIQNLPEPLEAGYMPEESVSHGRRYLAQVPLYQMKCYPPLAKNNVRSEVMEKGNAVSNHKRWPLHNFGYMPAEMQPVFNLARVASGYIIWQNSTENTWYGMVQIKSVKQVKRNDDNLEFSYVVLIHDIVSQEIIPWHMQVLWHPQHGVKVTQNSRQSK